MCHSNREGILSEMYERLRFTCLYSAEQLNEMSQHDSVPRVVNTPVLGCSLQRSNQEWRTPGRGECGWSAQDRSPQAAVSDESLTGPQHQSHGGE